MMYFLNILQMMFWADVIADVLLMRLYGSTMIVFLPCWRIVKVLFTFEVEPIVVRKICNSDLHSPFYVNRLV